MILDDIVEAKRKRIKEKLGNISIDELKQRAKRATANPAVDFKEILCRKDRISIIAEIKPASPSKGIIKENIDPVQIAFQYRNAGADVVSILTEEDYFNGQDDYLVKVRQRVPVPILRKDFIIDIKQIYHSRIIGADAILLITSILSDEDLNKFQIVSKILGMSCIVEVHSEGELKRALRAGAEIIGINNRNLKTFEIDIGTTERLIKLIPQSKAVVSESGINTYNDVCRVRAFGVDAVLVGEALMRTQNIEKRMKGLFGGGEGKNGCQG